MQTMIDYARAEGIEAIEGQVLTENTTMLRMCAELGFVMSESPDDPTVRVVSLPIASSESPVAP